VNFHFRPGLAKLLFIVLVLAASLSTAEDRPHATAGAPVSGQSQALLTKRQALAKQIAQLEQALPQRTQAEQASDRETIESLHAIDAIYLQHQNQLDQRAQLDEHLKEAEKQLAALDKFEPDEPKPYSFLLLDNLQDQLAAEKDRQAAIEADTKSSKQLLHTAHEELDAAPKADQDKRSNTGANQGAEEPATEDRKEHIEPPKRLVYVLARAKVALRETEIEVLGLRLKLCDIKQQQLAKKIGVIEKDVSFSAQDRDRQSEHLAQLEADLKRKRRAAEEGLQQLDTKKTEALKAISGEGAATHARDLILDAWRVATESYQSEVVVLDQRLDDLADVRRQWKHRYELNSGKVDRVTIAGWIADLQEFLDQLKETASSLQHRIDSARDDRTALDQEPLGPAGEDSRHWQAAKAERLQELRELCAAGLDEIKSNQQTLSRFLDELKTKLRQQPTDWVTGLRESVTSVFGETVAGEDESSITLGRLSLLIICIALGVAASYFVSRFSRRTLQHYFGFHPGTAAALKSMLFYMLCIVFGVVSFRLLHVPMTAFAFMGGAAAIAIGFGGQDIMNNFMSGLILLAEQPIRVGDVVEVEGTRGVVLHIGLRSTRLQTQMNHEMIVPNHALLDSAVTNLTLSDNFVLTSVMIGVDRDVDVQKAKWRMLEIAFAHPLVIKSPRPAVLMTDVDTYWITFEIRFWLEYSNYMQIAIVQSQILEQISDLFKPAPEKAAAENVPDESAPAEQPPEKTAQKVRPAADQMAADLQKVGSAVIAKQMKKLSGSVKFKTK
jgi:potassium-dependent mechanosensitive channel